MIVTSWTEYRPFCPKPFPVQKIFNGKPIKSGFDANGSTVHSKRQMKSASAFCDYRALVLFELKHLLPARIGNFHIADIESRSNEIQFKRDTFHYENRRPAPGESLVPISSFRTKAPSHEKITNQDHIHGSTVAPEANEPREGTQGRLLRPACPN